MQLDQANIAIRERNFGEILGLALHVCGANFAGWFLAGLIGAAPFALLNWLLLRDFVSPIDYEDDTAGYWFWYLFLVAIETPLATAPVTLLLGQSAFAARISPRVIWRNFRKSLPQMFLLQGIRRLLLMPVLLLPYFTSPYRSEVILLELNPLFGGGKQLTTLRRSRNLHKGVSGELVSRWLLSVAAALLLGAVIGGGIYSGLALLFSVRVGHVATHLYLVPATLWIVVAFFAVVRFLSYLDLRIRKEGWEVELLMRAEAQRMRQSMSFG